MKHGLLLCDKPSGPTSHDVVAIARRALGSRRIGHAGTLDPMATGLLVLAVGEARKLLRYLTLDDKCYEATLRLGDETDTLDAEGRVVDSVPVPANLDLAQIRAAARAFEGEIVQRVPDVSAIKRGGRPLYELARRGEPVDAPERRVLLRSLEIQAHRGTEIDLRIDCGKGFYVRALARDLARALGTVGHLCALRRTRSGRFTVEHGVGFEQLRAAAAGDEQRRAELEHALVPIRAALLPAPALALDPPGVDDARHGRPVAHARVTAGVVPGADIEPILLCDAAGEPVALARSSGSALHIVRGFVLTP